MSEMAIQTKGLSKRYRIGVPDRYPMFREALMQAASAPLRKFRSWLSGQHNGADSGWIWALKDVDFDVRKGEVIGIIGRNGAGKSTLLKVLTGITEPTAGYADIHGRVGSLLEVGTGFHMELTGRENIFMNGAMLGMRRHEIKQKFDEIVAFSEIEKFLETPVKRYSSGMYMRLAFAVAAHLNPEILLVDEVLAVGDAAFQKKCLGRMKDIANKGRTVLFVSHNMAAIQSLCRKVCLIDEGRLISQGAPNDVIEEYMQSFISQVPEGLTPIDQRIDRSGDGSAKFVLLNIETADGSRLIRSNSRLKFTIGYRSEKPVIFPRFIATVYDCNSNCGIFALDTELEGVFPQELPHEGTVTCVTEPINLTPGRCYVDLELFKGTSLVDCLEYATYFDVEPFDVYGSGRMPDRGWVISLIQHTWFPDDKKPISRKD